jgi:DNA modification methylase
MPKITLTDEDKLKLLEAVNAGVEPSPDLMPKLFPGTAEKFDVKALDRARVPTLEYAGKRSKAAILAEAGAGIGAAPLQVVRSFGEVKKDEWQNLIVQGDNLQFLKTCYRNEDPLIKDKVKKLVNLIYIDPPFATGDEYGGGEGERSYSAKVAGAEFVEAMRDRLFMLKELLSDTGSIFVRSDYHFSHSIKLVLDEVFGADNFTNEIVINRFKRQQKGLLKFNVGSESLFFYTNGDKSKFVEQERSRLCSFCGQEKDPEWHFMISSGLRRPPLRTIMGRQLLPPRGQHWKYVQEKIDLMTQEGRIRINDASSYTDLDGNRVHGMPEFLQTEDEVVDNNWTDLRGYAMNSQYPTENHEELLERVIKTCTEKGDLVVDVFGGSGTTAAVAEKLGRRWITCDFGKHAIYTMQKRLLNISSSNILLETPNQVFTGKITKKYRKEAEPFSVVSAGAYDFTHVMALGKPEHKEAYIAFVLGLFQLGRDEAKAKKYKLTNIYADKDGAPVEVYPVWDERYLKEVRIDETYLKGIIAQTGGRLRGEYLIITPESCTNIGETTLKNAEGKNVTFKFLTFPYKVLEDASRHLELHEQPASQSAVNELITSTAFYFNEDVEIAVKREGTKLKLTKFETKILDKAGNRFPEFDGLAMLLVDIDHEASMPFDMDNTVFAKDIGEDGTFVVGNIEGKKVAVIAIDKHGNESKPFIVK